jgi:tryptophanyl-tRNA synthetase
LGHYLGSLKNRVRYQSDHDCFFVIADLHTLTTRPGKEEIRLMNQYIHQIVLDYLSIGINPDQSTIFVQSSVPGIAELSTLLGMLVTAPRLERIPSLKEMARSAGLTTMPFGLLGYPVLMAADILIPRADLVPVGADNQGNVELAREIARRFNNNYGEIFPIPEMELEGTLVGTDGGGKMSKSLNNAIFLSDTPEVVHEKVMGMYTDPKRISADVPGEVEGNPVFIYHDAFNQDRDEVRDLKDRYRAGRVGDVEVKERLSAVLARFLEPIRERRESYACQADIVLDILHEGSIRMREESQETLELVREAMGLQSYLREKQGNGIENDKVMEGLAFL